MDVNRFGSIRKSRGRGFVVSHGGSLCKENAAGIACDCRGQQSDFGKLRCGYLRE